LFGFILFFFSVSYFESAPSSTSGLIIIPLIPITIISVFIAGLFGAFINWVLVQFKGIKPINIREIYAVSAIFSVAIVVLAIIVPYKLQSSWDAYNLPRIIRNSNVVEKFQFQKQTEKKYKNAKIQRFVVNFEDRVKGIDLLWDKKSYRAKFDSHLISFVDKNGEFFIQENLEGYDYIREIICLPFDTLSESDPLLIILANLRATSRKSMIIIYSSTGECVFQELLENIGSLKPARDAVTNKPILILELKNSEKYVYQLNNNKA